MSSKRCKKAGKQPANNNQTTSPKKQEKHTIGPVARLPSDEFLSERKNNWKLLFEKFNNNSCENSVFVDELEEAVFCAFENDEDENITDDKDEASDADMDSDTEESPITEEDASAIAKNTMDAINSRVASWKESGSLAKFNPRTYNVIGMHDALLDTRLISIKPAKMPYHSSSEKSSCSYRYTDRLKTDERVTKHGSVTRSARMQRHIQDGPAGEKHHTKSEKVSTRIHSVNGHHAIRTKRVFVEEVICKIGKQTNNNMHSGPKMSPFEKESCKEITKAMQAIELSAINAYQKDQGQTQERANDEASIFQGSHIETPVITEGKLCKNDENQSLKVNTPLKDDTLVSTGILEMKETNEENKTQTSKRDDRKKKKKKQKEVKQSDVKKSKKDDATVSSKNLNNEENETKSKKYKYKNPQSNKKYVIFDDSSEENNNCK